MVTGCLHVRNLLFPLAIVPVLPSRAPAPDQDVRGGLIDPAGHSPGAKVLGYLRELGFDVAVKSAREDNFFAPQVVDSFACHAVIKRQDSPKS